MKRYSQMWNPSESKGSMTLFVSLSLLLVASLIFTLLESARVHGLKAYTAMTADLASESLFSEYEDWIFRHYDIFLMDASFGTGNISISGMNGELLRYAAYTLAPEDVTFFGNGVNFYQMTAEASVTDYLLATDYNGSAFRQMVCEQYRHLIGADEAKKLLQRLTEDTGSAEEDTDMERIMQDASQGVAEIRAAQAENGEDDKDLGFAEDIENPMDTVQAVSRKDVLNLVVPEGRAISGKQTDLSSAVRNRTLNTGNMEPVYTDSLLDTVWFNKYIEEHTACFLDRGTGEDFAHALDYELEFILGGKSADRENLKTAAAEILAVREAANFLYLEKDAAKRESALALAAAILAPTGVGEVGAVVLQQGILAAWAFAESVLDVRALLDGKRIPLMKDAASWTCGVEHIREALTGSLESRDSEHGTDYRGYLEKLIYLKQASVCSVRMMELIEQNYRLTKEGADFRIDHCVIAAKADFVCSTRPLFLSFVTLLQGEKSYGAFRATGTIKY